MNTMESKTEQLNQTEKDIRDVCDGICNLLIQKNRAYGDSALNPRRIFSRADALEQINVRIDDKLSRIANIPAGQMDSMGEEPERDLMGYLVLKFVAKLRQQRPKQDTTR
jgi:hypothetical protein